MREPLPTTPLTEAAQRVQHALVEQPGHKLSERELAARTQLTPAQVDAAIRELLGHGWVSQTSSMSFTNLGWRLTSFGKRVDPRAPVDPALWQMPQDTILLCAPRDRGLSRALLAATVLYALLVGLLVLGWKWVGILLLLFVGVWLGLLLSELNRRTQEALLTPTALLTRTWYGRSVRTPRESLAQIALVKVHVGGAGKGATTLPYMLFLNAQGHCLNWLLTNHIPIGSQKTFAHHCEVPLRDLRGEERNPRQLKHEFPGTTVDPRAAKTLAILGVMVLVLALTLLLLIATGAYTAYRR